MGGSDRRLNEHFATRGFVIDTSHQILYISVETEEELVGWGTWQARVVTEKTYRTLVGKSEGK
jgi:hypothetical protein